MSSTLKVVPRSISPGGRAMTKSKETLAEFVMRTRNERGMSCADVERQSARYGKKIAASYVNRIENGLKVRPTADRLQALARGLGVPLDELWAYATGQTPGSSDKAEEQRLVMMFRDLPDEKRADFLRMMEALHGSPGTRKRKTA